MAPIIIRSTCVLLPAGLQAADIEIDGDRIAAVRRIGPGAPSSDAAHAAAEARDFRDAVVMPGIVDTHVHVNEPGRTGWEGFASAVDAAAAGGITTIVDMPLNCVPPTTTVAALDAKRRLMPEFDIDVAFWGGVVPGNTDALEGLVAAGVRGFKCFLSPSGVDEFASVSIDDLREALPILARHDMPLLVHAEWPSLLRPVSVAADRRSYRTWADSRPPEAEVEAIRSLISLCREFGARIHVVHLATEAALRVLRQARADGLPITVETCPHYLTFAAEDIGDGATLFKCAPPIRGRAARDALWRGLEAGDIDLIASDHSPCPPEMKGGGDFVAAWGGVAALELSLPAVWTGARARGIAIERLAEWMCAAPARLANLGRRKGAIAAGADADLVIWDPDAAVTVDAAALHQRHKLTPYAGWRLRGRVIATWARGRVVYGDSGV